MNEIKLHTKEIINMYVNENLGGESIGKKFNCSHTTVYTILQENGIDRKINTWKSRKYTLEEDYFNKIDSKEKAYWLGLLFADGYNEGDTMRLGLKEEDKYLLEKFKIALNSNRKLRFIPKREPTHQNQIRLEISGNRFCKDLENLGMVRAKSLILKFPRHDQLPAQFISHFIRGYFDGDGCITLTKGQEKYAHVSLCVSKVFAEELMYLLKKLLQIEFSLVLQSKIHRMCLGGRLNCIKFLDWIYQDAGDLYMTRKYKKYKKIKEYNPKNKNATSKYFGVHFLKKQKKNPWCARVSLNYKNIHIGIFPTEFLAAKAYNTYILNNNLEKQLNNF